MSLQPAYRRRVQRLCLSKAFVHRGLRNDVARILGQIALFSKPIEPHKHRVVYAKCLPKALDRRLMVTRLAGERPKSASVETDVGQHANCRVGAGESRFSADLAHLRVGDVTRRAVQQTQHRLPGGGDLLKAYAEQVFETH